MYSKWIARLGFATLVAIGGVANADVLTPYVGVQFVQGGPALASTDIAGVLPQGNFNAINVNNSTGTNQASNLLNDANGDPTLITLSQSSYDGYHSQTDTSTANGALLNGEDKSGTRGTSSYTFNNIPNGTYSLIAYTENDYPWSGAVDAEVSVGATTEYIQDEAVASGTPAFLLANNTDPSALGYGNYVEFDGLVPVDGSLTLYNFSTNGGSAAINGFQLAQDLGPSAVPEPASFSLLLICGGGLMVRRRAAR